MKHIKNKKYAFTMLELVFVIVVAGILTAAIVPRFDRNSLQEAADQIISHIRYTRHLAMIDDKFTANDSKWFKGRWTISFYKNLTFTSARCTNGHYQNIWAYTIFSDTPTYQGKPTMKEMARDPINQDQLLSGGYNNTLCIDNAENTDDNQSIKSMRLREKYGIKDMKFSGGCRSNVRHLSFDYLGRPFNSLPSHTAYELSSSGYHNLLTTKCIIDICTVSDCNNAGSDEKITIAIEPETGYTHIL